MGKTAESFKKALTAITAPHGALADLIRQTKISRPTFERWLEGTNAPDLNQLDIVADAVGKPPWELLFGKTESSLPWREVIRRVGDLNDSQVPAVVAGITAALAALRLDEKERGMQNPHKLPRPPKS